MLSPGGTMRNMKTGDRWQYWYDLSREAVGAWSLADDIEEEAMWARRVAHAQNEVNAAARLSQVYGDDYVDPKYLHVEPEWAKELS